MLPMPRDGEPRKLKTALVSDLFCGAGGSSSGAKRALERLGYRMELVAVNHWHTAIATHSANHPDARHYCADVNAVKPAEVVPEGKLGLLIAVAAERARRDRCPSKIRALCIAMIVVGWPYWLARAAHGKPAHHDDVTGLRGFCRERASAGDREGDPPVRGDRSEPISEPAF
jgi:hypothetical protein